MTMLLRLKDPFLSVMWRFNVLLLPSTVLFGASELDPMPMTMLSAAFAPSLSKLEPAAFLSLVTE